MRDGAENGDMADVDARLAHARELERAAQELEHLDVRGDARLAEHLRADLDRLASRARR